MNQPLKDFLSKPDSASSLVETKGVPPQPATTKDQGLHSPLPPPDNRYQPDTTNARQVAAAVITGAVILYLVIVSLETLFYAQKRQRRIEVQDVPSRALRSLKRLQQAQLSYRWINQKKGVVAMPIRQAMRWEIMRNQRLLQQLDKAAKARGRSTAVPGATPGKHGRRSGNG